MNIEFVSNLSTWNQVMIDNLNPRHNIKVIECLSLSFDQILNSKVDISEIIIKSLYPVILKIKYNVKNNQNFDFNAYREKIIKFLQSPQMLSILINKITISSKTNIDWIEEMMFSKENFQRNTDLLSVLLNFISIRVELILTKIIGELEKNNSLDFFFQEYDDQNFKEELYKIWNGKYQKIEINNLKPLPNAVGIPVDKIQNLFIPFSIENFMNIFMNYKDEFSVHLNAYNNNEDDLRFLIIKEEKYIYSKNKVCDDFKNYFDNKTCFMKLVENNKMLAEKCIISDFLNYYLVYELKENTYYQIYLDFLKEIIEFKFEGQIISTILWFYTYSIKDFAAYLFRLFRSKKNTFETNRFQKDCSG